MADKKPAEYEVTASNGRVYRITAGDDAQAHEIANWLETRIAEGDDDLMGDVSPPLNTQILRPARPDVEGADYINTGGLEGQVSGQGERQLDRSGVVAGIDSFLRGAANTAIPFMDEIAAGVDAVVPISRLAGTPVNSVWDGSSFSDAYEHNVNLQRQIDEADATQNPVLRGTGNVGGAILQAIGAGKLLKMGATAIAPRLGKTAIGPVAAAEAYQLAHPVKTAIVAGGAGGGISGAINAAGEGEDLQTRLDNAQRGGAIGTMFGATVAPVAVSLAPAIARYANVLFGRLPEREATHQLIQALQRDGYDVTSPTGVKALRDELGSYLGKPVSLADVGIATRSRAGVGLRAPSNVQNKMIDLVHARQAGQNIRLASDVRATVAPRTDVHALDEALIKTREEEALPLRDEALFENGSDSTLPITAYRGGAKFDPSHPTPSFFTSDEDAARSYIGMHEERYGTPGVLEKFNLNIRNPLDLSADIRPDIVELARKAGVAEENIDWGTTSSWFDHSLNPPGSSERLIKMLRERGYDGVKTMDVPWSGSAREEGKYIDAFIPFDNSAATPFSLAASGRQSRIPEDPILQQLARLPFAQRALKSARALAQEEVNLGTVLGNDVSHLPDVTADGANLDMRTLDYLKRFLDKEVSKLGRQADSNTFSAAEYPQVKALRDALRERMREVVPKYGDYLDSYRGSSDLIDALHEGRTFSQLDPELIAKQQNAVGRSTAEKELYRVGVARNLLDEIGSTRDGSNAASRILNSDEARAQLAATGVAPQDAAKLGRSVAIERQFNLLPAELSGNASAARNVANSDADAGVHAQLPFNPGSPLGWLGAAGRTILNHTSTVRNRAVNEALLPQMLETNPQAIDAIISNLEKAGKYADAAKLRRALNTYAGTAALGNLLGSGSAMQEGN